MHDGPVTKREVFSVCGKLTGHCPVAGWLHVACSFVKSAVAQGDWDEAVVPDAAEIL